MILNALTIDLEEHHHFCGLKRPVADDPSHRTSLVVPQAERVLALLARNGVRATFFVLGSVAEQYPDLIRRIAREGHEIGSHGYQHEMVYRQTPAEFEEDVRRALRPLEGLTTQPVLGYRAASFSITRESTWAFSILKRLGFRYDCSVFPIRHPRYGLPGAPRLPHQRDGLTVFPLSVLRVGSVNVPIAGGAYVRLLPFAFVRWAYRRLNRQGLPVQFYVHPWELDPAIPRLPVPWHRGVTHYANLDRMAGRLEQLLDEFAFAPVREVLGLHAD